MVKVKIKQFKNKAKEPVAGLTPEHAIYDKNGVRLDAKLGNVNLQEFRDLQQQCVNNINAKVVLMVCDKKKDYVVERAKNHNVEALVFNPKDYASKNDYEAMIVKRLKELNVDLICLAG